MREFSRALIFFGIALTLLVLAQPAQAQATRTWVSGVGDDANPCSRTAPCKTFAGAISKTAAGGEINIIDPGAFGAVTITKSITISAEGLQAGVLASATNGIVVNAGANDVVVIRGLDIDGTGTTPGLNGIRFLAGAALVVQNCLIRNFKGGSPNGFGILFAPTTTAKLYVSNTKISNNGAAGTGGGVMVQPSGAVNASATLNDVELFNNSSGFTLNGSSSSGGTGNQAIIRNSVVSGSVGTGITVVSTAQGSSIAVHDTDVFNNATGIQSNGNVTAVIVNGAYITRNVTGVTTANGGSVISFKNNSLQNNPAGNTFTASIDRN